MAKDAGFKGHLFRGHEMAEASTNAADIQWLADAGFEMTSIYHFMDDGGKAVTRRKFDFDLVVDASKPFWERRNETGILPFLPNLATGWDDRPWNDHMLIAERTSEKFAEICRQFKQFSKESGISGRCSLRSTNGVKGLMPSPAANSDSGCTKPFARTCARNRNPAGR